MSLLHDDDAIKEAFRKVKEHMAILEKELRADREFIIALNSTLEQLNKRIKALEEAIRAKNNNLEQSFLEQVKPKKMEDLDFCEQILEEKPLISNSGMVSPQERKGFLATRQRHFDTLATPFRHPSTIQNIDLEELKANLNKVFLSLTNREFKVFIAIYTLEEQNKSPITYNELAQHLDLSSSSIRDYISELIRKGAPILKEKNRNCQAYVSVSKEFRSLNLMSKLLALRSLSNDQKSLFDSF
jgi:DNA-directed RNA polymerase sigma subunit (sigma70/sigma32)